MSADELERLPYAGRDRQNPSLGPQNLGPQNYHCCATCEHFASGREDGRVYTRCRRLGYDTKSFYRFNCWSPRPDVIARMKGR